MHVNLHVIPHSQMLVEEKTHISSKKPCLLTLLIKVLILNIAWGTSKERNDGLRNWWWKWEVYSMLVKANGGSLILRGQSDVRIQPLLAKSYRVKSNMERGIFLTCGQALKEWKSKMPK